MTQYTRKFENKEVNKILKNMVILCDTREKNNFHITKYFDINKINYKQYSLSTGDYSVMLPKTEELDILSDMYFDKSICVERKASLDELSNNLCYSRERIKDEFGRARMDNTQLHLLIEDKEGYSSIVNHKYNTEFKPMSFLGSLFALQQKYKLNLTFLDRQLVGSWIYYTMYYFLRDVLIN